jgi:Dolichyl-phosphate-mannose-protein mannosyltransferase
LGHQDYDKAIGYQQSAIAPKRPAVALSAAVFVIAAVKLALHLYTGRHYGYFVDELYYLACSRHLDWGYVDQPPLIAAVTWAIRHTLGDSLAAIRFLPGLAGAAEIVLTGMLVRSLGGGRFGQAIAAVALLAAPGVLVADNFLSMNAFEPLFWLVCALIVVRILQTGDTRLWIWFGLVAGFGLENKYSMLIFGGGVVVGLLLTAERRILATRWLWVGGAVAALIFLPNLLWNVYYHFPFLELQANIRRSGRDVPLAPVAFFAQETLAMFPLTLPLWVGGLWYYFRQPEGRPYRFLGWAWIFCAVVIVAMSPRVYYLFPAFPVLFAAGGIACDRWLSRPRLEWLKPAWAALTLTAAAALSPISIPVLPPEQYIRYSRALHIEQPRIETHELGPLPQLFADQFGWEEMTQVVARVYNALPPDVRARTAIFGQNYGQAGAIDLFGPKYGLPPAISGHQSYFLWGPRNYTGESMIVMADRRERLEKLFSSVEKAGTVYHPYSMPYEHFDVFYCRGPKQNVAEAWPRVKNWD